MKHLSFPREHLQSMGQHLKGAENARGASNPALAQIISMQGLPPTSSLILKRLKSMLMTENHKCQILM